jgi:hypothetical protein
MKENMLRRMPSGMPMQRGQSPRLLKKRTETVLPVRQKEGTQLAKAGSMVLSSSFLPTHTAKNA